MLGLECDWRRCIFCTLSSLNCLKWLCPTVLCKDQWSVNSVLLCIPIIHISLLPLHQPATAITNLQAETHTVPLKRMDEFLVYSEAWGKKETDSTIKMTGRTAFLWWLGLSLLCFICRNCVRMVFAFAVEKKWSSPLRSNTELCCACWGS